ncbi:MAG: MBL fold metallo-hydrolase [Betaproteobacteria bacterium]|nr:MBL fold metallo-hydrolase [Betaproteobacteria bacterium]
MQAVPALNLASVFEPLHLQVLQRDWLSSNQVVLLDPHGGGASVVDTGYSSHATQSVALLEATLQGRQLVRILNTHLHSDHCGGNCAIQARWPEVQTWVPQAAFEKARSWDQERLTYRLTGQTCHPFRVDHALHPGQAVELGGYCWQVHAVGGHDPDAVLLFQAEHRVLISGDALWRSKVALIFPELDGEDGFGPALAGLDLIESLAPAVVIPGHGEPFWEVDDALAISRKRLQHLQANPEHHARHALRVMMVFHLLEHRRRDRDALCAWMADCPLAQREAVRHLMQAQPQTFAPRILQSLVDDGVVKLQGADVVMA